MKSLPRATTTLRSPSYTLQGSWLGNFPTPQLFSFACWPHIIYDLCWLLFCIWWF
jgi:hypothetical protein